MKMRLKELREQHHLRQRDVDEVLMTTNAYAHYERGETSLPLEVLIRLADFYHVSVDYILFRTENPKPPPPKPNT